MVRIGLVGVGFMGQQHFVIYEGMEKAELVAVCDKAPARVAEEAASVGGNIGEATELDLSKQNRYTSLEEMLAEEQLDCVDVCTPTFLHAEVTIAALEAGCNVICEKPMALTVEDCDRMIAAAKANSRLLFIAQCIRFWPEYEVLANMVSSGELGQVISARFVRQSPTPTWASDNWLMDAKLSGGAMLDLHIHDVDFILSLFGKPKAVVTRAGNLVTEGHPVDQIFTAYLYDDFACAAECGWVMPDSFPFEMGYQVLGAKGMLEFSLAKAPMLTFYPFDGEPYAPELAPGTGYERELPYFVECIESNTPPARVTPESARDSVRLVMAEVESAATGAAVEVSW